MNRSRKAVALAFAAAAVTLGVTVAAAPANAATVTPNDANGVCSGINNSAAFTGWCDGTGPEYYRAIAWCSDGVHADVGVSHWFGDNRGSTADCSAFGGLSPKWGFVRCTSARALGGYRSMHGATQGVIDPQICTFAISNNYSYAF
jgi:hypothetical protein